jgi:hypothetical protein
MSQLTVALGQDYPDEALKSLRQGRIRDVPLVLLELPGGEQPTLDERPVQLVDHRGLADAGIARDQHELRPATLDHAVEGGEQGPSRSRP